MSGSEKPFNFMFDQVSVNKQFVGYPSKGGSVTSQTPKVFKQEGKSISPGIGVPV